MEHSPGQTTTGSSFDRELSGDASAPVYPHLPALAAYVAETPSSSIVPEAIEYAKFAAIDFIGAAIAGTLEPISKIVESHITACSKGTCTLIGAQARVSAVDAAFFNGTAGHAIDYDDSSFVQGGHPTCTLLPAVLAVGEERASSGREILEAYVVGYEITMKFSRAVNFEHYFKGWHPTSTLGALGAAAAVARLIRLDATKVQHALGIAASLASGIKSNVGTVTKPFQAGHASHKGALAALMAQAGVTASEGALEAKQGFFEVYNGPGKYDLDSMSFSPVLEIIDPGLRFKRYPCCGSTHSAIDAALRVAATHAPAPDDIRSVEVAIERRRAHHTDRPTYNSGYEGKFSLQYLVSAALTDGKLGVAHFTDESAARQELRRLADRVKVLPVDCGNTLSDVCDLTVHMVDGSTLKVHLDSAEGRTTVDYPKWMRTKFLDCAQEVFDLAQSERLLAALMALDKEEDIRRFTTLLRE
ncbi:MmgE/PrpD family protein [Pseudochelatococcus lubricantis]|uniref:MmgE/PrpD family protein n=1 Tax=Pseudochelatococcus lubricantis TaxID=1538102 RepID=UPI0035EAD9F5